MKRTQVLLIALLACAVPSFSAAQAATPPADAAAAPTPVPGQMGEESDYIIGPNDTVQIFVWRNPDLSVTVPVRPDGKMTSPMVEDLVAVGKTPSGLARAIEQRLAEYIRNPQVNVIVTDPQSAYSKVTARGQVKNPKSVPYTQGMTVFDLVTAVGGLADFASGNRSTIKRKDASGKETEIRVRLNDLMKKGRGEDIALKPGDVLFVPESPF